MLFVSCLLVILNSKQHGIDLFNCGEQLLRIWSKFAKFDIIYLKVNNISHTLRVETLSRSKIREIHDINFRESSKLRIKSFYRLNHVFSSLHKPPKFTRS